MNRYIVETRHLNFGFAPATPIIHDLNLQVPEQSIFCFLGPNGAGKTTTIRLLLGLLKTKQHSVSIFGDDLSVHRRAILRRIGAMIEQPSLYLHLSAKENLEVFRLAYDAPKARIGAVLEMVGLEQVGRKPVGQYSLGMKQRLGIAMALLNDPELLILDEPTNGLDPEGIIEIRLLLKRLHAEHRKTILVSSHLLSEVDKVATHFAIIHKGRLQFQGPKEALHQTLDHSTVELETTDVDKVYGLLGEKYTISQQTEAVLHIKPVSKAEIPALIQRLTQHEIKIYKLGVLQDNLEEIFIQTISA